MIQEFSLSGRTALVIGAAGDLGRHQALGLARAGANVALADLNGESLDSLQLEIKRLGRKACHYVLDVTDPAAVNQTVAAVAGEFREIHILVNSAGITRRGASEDYDQELFERILDINLNGTFYACQSVGKIMIQQGGGRIINMGSIFSAVGILESPAYAMSKGAVGQLTRALAVEWAPHHIAVNAILPSWFDTQMGKVDPSFYKGAAKAPSQEELKKRTIGRVPLKRLGKPQEIVGATVFLASDAASMVTGHSLAVDGGFLIQ